MTAPTFLLPSCPICSTVMATIRPVWHRATNTSAARKRNCYILMGCSHAVGTSPSHDIVEDPEGWKVTEEIWEAEAERLFALKTERWTDVERANFKRQIEDKHTLPGATDALPLEPIEQQKSDAQTKTMARVVAESPFGENL